MPVHYGEPFSFNQLKQKVSTFFNPELNGFGEKAVDCDISLVNRSIPTRDLNMEADLWSWFADKNLQCSKTSFILRSKTWDDEIELPEHDGAWDGNDRVWDEDDGVGDTDGGVGDRDGVGEHDGVEDRSDLPRPPIADNTTEPVLFDGEPSSVQTPWTTSFELNFSKICL